MEALKFDLSYAWTKLTINMSSVMTSTSSNTPVTALSDNISPVSPTCHYRNDNVSPSTSTIPSPRPGHPTEPLQLEDQAPPDAAEDETQYTRSKLLASFSAATLAISLVALDGSILATAVPHITDEFGTIGDVGWYSAGYRLSLCAFQFMYGRVYRLWSLKKVFMGAIVLFELGSFLCGISPTSGTLVAGRVFQGFAAAGIVSGCFAMLTFSVPLRQRPMFLGTVSMIETIIGAVGPLIGGVITERSSWRWCFYMNLPIGVVALLLIGFFFEDMKASEDVNLPWTEKVRKVDLTGTVLFIPGIVSLLLALQFGGSKFGWSDPRIITCLVLSVILIGVFGAWQIHKGEDATLPPRIVKKRSILAGMLFGCCNNGLLNVVEYYIPIYFQTVQQASPQQSGLLILPLILSLTFSVFAGGAVVSWIGYWVPTMFFTSIITPIACGLLSTLPMSALIKTCIYLGLLGFSSGLGFQGPQIAAQTLLSRADVPTGIALIQFSQSFGPAVLIPAAQNLFTGQLSRDLDVAAPGINATGLEGMGLSDLRDKVAESRLAGTLLGFDRALMQTMYLPTAIACLLIFATAGMEWKSVKKTS